MGKLSLNENLRGVFCLVFVNILMKQNLQIRAVIHLGSTAVHTVVGYPDNHGRHLKIMAVGVAKTQAFFGGQIHNHSELLRAIKSSANQAMDMAGVQFTHVGLSFAAPNMRTDNGQSRVYLVDAESPNLAGKAIHIDDIAGVLKELKNDLLKNRVSPIQITTQFAALDVGKTSERTAKDPVGLFAHNMYLSYHLITVPRTYHQQMNDVFAQSNLAIYPPIFAGVAGAEYALTETEKERGVCFVDIGAGTTNVCVYSGGMLIFSRCFSVAGSSVDADIAKWLNISEIEAEFIKKNQGSAYPPNIPKGHFIPLRRSGRHDEIVINQHELSTVIENRYFDIFSRILNALDQENIRGFLKEGIVLAGGGAKMNDLTYMARKFFNVAVRQISVNNCVSVCANDLNDDNIILINQHLVNNTLYNAIGALLYQQSKQYERDEQFLYPQIESNQGWFGRLGQAYKQTANLLKKWM